MGEAEAIAFGLMQFLHTGDHRFLILYCSPSFVFVLFLVLFSSCLTSAVLRRKDGPVVGQATGAPAREEGGEGTPRLESLFPKHPGGWCSIRLECSDSDASRAVLQAVSICAFPYALNCKFRSATEVLL